MDDIREEMEKRKQEKRKKRQQIVLMQRCALAGILFLVILTILLLFFRRGGGENIGETAPENQRETYVEMENISQISDEENETQQEESTPSNAAEVETEPETEEIGPQQAAIYDFNNLGIANVTDFLNIRETPEAGTSIVGRMPSGAGAEILATENGWSHIRSGEIEGYVQSQYLWTGEEAQEQALGYLKEIAVVNTEVVNIRREPIEDAENIVGEGHEGDRFDVISQEEGWIQVPEGYLSTDYVDILFELEEATAF